MSTDATSQIQDGNTAPASTGGAAPPTQSTGATITTTASSTGATLQISSTGGTTAGSTAGGLQPFWKDGWRQDLAGANPDPKVVARLSRFSTPADIWKSYLELEKRLSSGELKQGLKPGATPEDVAAWRKENGIPEKPEGYDLTFDNGLVIGDEDRPMVNKFLAAAHEKNLTPDQAKGAIAWYYDSIDAAEAERADKDTAAQRATEDALRQEWGTEYRLNFGMIHSLLDQAPAGLKDKFLTGRLSDGTPIGSDPDALRWLASLSRELNPSHTIVPAGGGDIGKSVEDEINTLKAMMGNLSSEYWKGPKADGHQARYRQLLEAREKITARG